MNEQVVSRRALFIERTGMTPEQHAVENAKPFDGFATAAIVANVALIYGYTVEAVERATEGTYIILLAHPKIAMPQTITCLRDWFVAVRRARAALIGETTGAEG